MSKPEKLTFTLEQQTRAEVAEWARQEQRPLGNLLRKIVVEACAQRQQSQAA